MGRGERETTSGDSRVESVLIAMRVSELPARDSSTKYSRTEDGREGRESAGHRTTKMRKCGLGWTRRQAAAVTYVQAPAAGAHKQMYLLLSSVSDGITTIRVSVYSTAVWCNGYVVTACAFLSYKPGVRVALATI